MKNKIINLITIAVLSVLSFRSDAQFATVNFGGKPGGSGNSPCMGTGICSAIAATPNGSLNVLFTLNADTTALTMAFNGSDIIGANQAAPGSFATTPYLFDGGGYTFTAADAKKTGMPAGLTIKDQAQGAVFIFGNSTPSQLVIIVVAVTKPQQGAGHGARSQDKKK